MGKKDIGLKSYLRNMARYADLWNGGVFCGKQIVKAEELQEMTPVRSKSDKQAVVERTGDLVMKQNYDGQRFAVLSLENQDEIDYEMLKKDDRLFPVATLIVYWGKEEWQGPRSLHDMIDFGEGSTMLSRELRRWIPEYPLHFLDLSTFEHFEYFRTELRPLLELFKRRGSRKKFMEYLEQNKEYWDMNDESWHILGQLTNFKNIDKFIKRKNERGKEEKRMFIDDMIDEAEAKGKAEGKAEDIIDLLEEHGAVKGDLKTEILRQTDLRILKDWHKLAARVRSIDEFAEKIHVLADHG